MFHVGSSKMKEKRKKKEKEQESKKARKQENKKEKNMQSSCWKLQDNWRTHITCSTRVCRIYFSHRCSDLYNKLQICFLQYLSYGGPKARSWEQIRLTKLLTLNREALTTLHLAIYSRFIAKNRRNRRAQALVILILLLKLTHSKNNWHASFW